MIRIAITGPECCGKTALCDWLGKNIFDARVVAEYSREYLSARGEGYEYTREDLLEIARTTAAKLTKAFKSTSDALVVDTDFYVLDIWWKELFGEENEEIQILKDTFDFDLYLLCEPDLPWEYDPLRENPHDRDRLFDLYQRELKADGRTVEIVRGTGEDRMKQILLKIMRRFPNLMTEEEGEP
jgi:nicotinamide riboside kinase